ncbi:MAG: RluA family pseudouridine synthase [Sedimentisphaerales bacterium]|nr:RluA family pseudouridine synthase [Sedimentisphaerales bacterium]
MAADFSSEFPAQEPSDEEVLEVEGDEEIGQHLRFRVGYSIKFRRLDKYLCGRFSQFSRSRLQKLIKEQGVNVNGQPAKPSHKLNPRDEIDLILPPRELRELTPEPIPIHVLYEDEEIIVVNKQADLIVHPARGYKSGTLVNGLVYYANQLSRGSDEYRPGIVHRLDKNTTGVLIVAKTDHAHWKLSRQFADRTTKKTYIAVVHGVPELHSDRIKAPIGVHPRVREKCAVRPDGKEAVTYYQVVEAFRGFALVQLRLETGRTHQIRVHMEYIKHPIVADDMYGGKVVYPWQIEDRDPAPEEPLMGRVALHAWKLEIKHPTTLKVMEFIAPLPDDMQRFTDHLHRFRSL